MKIILPKVCFLILQNKSYWIETIDKELRIMT